jgi:DNA polymerase-3 subunit delta
MKYSFRKLKLDIERGELAPVYFFYGPEELLKEEVVQSLIQRLVPPELKDFNLDVLYGDETDGAQIVDRASALPMMIQRRVVVVRNVNQLGLPDRKRLLVFLKRPFPHTCLVLTSLETNISRGFCKDLQRVTDCVGFFLLKDKERSSWVQQRARRYGKSMDPQASRMLCESVAEGLTALDNEIQKLALYVGDKAGIDPLDVTAVVGELRTLTVYQLCDAVGSRDLPEAMARLNRLLEAGIPAADMLRALRRHLSRLARVRGTSQKGASPEKVAADLRIAKNHVEGYIRQSANFREPDMEAALIQLFRTEFKLKTGIQDAGTAMMLLVYRLCEPTGAWHYAES